MPSTGNAKITENEKINLKYIESFGDPESDAGTYKKDSRIAKAYEVALDIRKFEIDLYWKRSGSFWLLVGGIAAALGFTLSGKIDSTTGIGLSERAMEIVCCCLSMAGATISYAWSLVNIGSKFWQRNWEYQVDILEQGVLGPLYKTVFSKERSGTMYSVSEINIWISRYVCLIFSLATIAFVIGKDGAARIFVFIAQWESLNPDVFKEILIYAAKLILVLANFILIFYIRRKVRSDSKKIEYDVKAEASVRKIFVQEPKGSTEAKEMWETLTPRTSTEENITRGFSIQSAIGCIKALFK